MNNLLDKDKKGIFRNSFNGFNKVDVHNYIDALLVEHANRLKIKNKQINNLEERTIEVADYITRLENKLETETQQISENEDSLKKENQKLVRKLEFESRKVKSVYSENSGLLKDCEEKKTLYQKEIKTLQAQIVELSKNEKQAEFPKRDIIKFSSMNAELETLHSKLQVLSKSNISLVEEKEKYRSRLHECQNILAETEQKLQELQSKDIENKKLMEDVGSFIFELHNMGKALLETSYRQSEESLESLETAVKSVTNTVLEADNSLNQARNDLESQKTSNSKRLTEMIENLKNK